MRHILAFALISSAVALLPACGGSQTSEPASPTSPSQPSSGTGSDASSTPSSASPASPEGAATDLGSGGQSVPGKQRAIILPGASGDPCQWPSGTAPQPAPNCPANCSWNAASNKCEQGSGM